MEDSKTIWCGNLADQVTEELLYELFLQVGPLERVKIPIDKSGRKMCYGFITFKHELSRDYALHLLNGTCLFDKNLNIQYRNKITDEPNGIQNDINLNKLPNVSEVIRSHSNNYRQRSNKNSEHYNRQQDRHSPYERRSPHHYRNDHSSKKYGDFKRDLNERRKNRSWY